MITEFIAHVSDATGLPSETAEAAVGIVLNAADRQGMPMAEEIFERVPGARTLAAGMGGQIGAATGIIARMIERTPGGRVVVAEQVVRDLHRIGLGNHEIGRLFPAIGTYAGSVLGVPGVGHLGDVFGYGKSSEPLQRRS